MQRWRGREGDPGRPQGGRSAAAGADITPATGRGRFAPTPTRHAADGVQSDKKDTLRVTAKRGVRGCRGCRGVFPSHPMPRAGQATCRPLRAAAAGQGRGKNRVRKPLPLSPHAPRRAGDPPPMPGSSRDARKNKTNGKARQPRLTPCPAPGRRPAAHAGQQPRCTEGTGSIRPGRFTFSKLKRSRFPFTPVP